LAAAFPGYRVRAPTTVAPRIAGNKSAVRFDASERIHAPGRRAWPYHAQTWAGPEPGVCPEGIIGSMEDLKVRLADAEAKLSHVKEYL
jgi:hypothetical protein